MKADSKRPMYRFDLEAAIAAWRQSFRLNLNFLEDDLDELENHLRDHVQERIAVGDTVEAAYRVALRQLGDYADLESEFGKVRYGATRRRRNLRRTGTWHAAMLANYMRSALRGAKRQPIYTVINLGGLAVGLAACAFVLLLIRHELIYDRYHEDAERIFRIAEVQTREGLVQGRAHVHTPFIDALETIPEIEKLVTVGGAGSKLVRRDGEMFWVDGIASADTDVFEVFSLQLVRGDPATALKEPYTLVVTESLGNKLFGSEDPMGRVTMLGDHEYTVTGVIKPVPAASHWRFDGLTSMASIWAELGPMADRIRESWLSVANVYVKLHSPNDVAAVEHKLKDVVAAARPVNVDPAYRLFLQPLTSIHLHSHLIGELGSEGSVSTLYVFSAIALLILLIACINYVNLATARASRRAREIGVRKVVGANRRQLVGQLLGESILTCLLAVVLAASILRFALPYLSEVAQRPLSFSAFNDPFVALGLLGLGLLVGLTAGVWPAVLASGFKPAGLLRTYSGLTGNGRLRRVLVVVQFVVSIGFLAGTAIVYDQLSFLRTADLGFARDQIISITVMGKGDFNEKYRIVKEELQRLPHVTAVAASTGMPGVEPWAHTFKPDFFENGASLDYAWFGVDFDFLDLFEIDVVSGRKLDPLRSTDSTSAFLINETAARAMHLDEPLGQQLQLELNDRSGTIVGVVKDFHQGSLHEQIRPTLLYITPHYFYTHVHVRTDGADVSQTVSDLKRVWTGFFPDGPFEFSFFDDAYRAQYEAEEVLGRTAGLITTLALFVACMGLFGLASFAAEQRTKEIGLRKALGASVTSVVVLLCREFLLLVLIACLFAVPLTLGVAGSWLDRFAYHIQPSAWSFLIAAIVSMAIALAAVGGQAARAARANPVESLRCE